MFLYEAIVVYLAVGAPIAVMYLLKNRKLSKIRSLGMASAVISLWLPLIAFAGIKRLFIRSNTDFAEYARLDVEIDRRVRELVALLNERSIKPIEWLRTGDVAEPLERYAALSLAVIREKATADGEKTELFRIAGHQYEDLAIKCLARRNRRRLIGHQQRAADDLVESLRFIRCDGGIGEINAKIAEIADLLADGKTKEEIFAATQSKPVTTENGTLVTKIAA